jgi:hypothetical protein
MVKNVYREQVCFEWHKRFKKGSESENAKIAGENNVDCIFFILKVSFIKNLCWKTTVNVKFYNEMIKRSIARVHGVRPEFQESGSWYLLHDNAPAHSSGVIWKFLAKRGIPVLSRPLYSPDLAPANFFIS